MSLHDFDGLDVELGLAQIQDLQPSHVRPTYNVREAQCHSGGIAQGGFVCGWIDAAMSRLLRAVYGEDALTLTLEIKVSFLGPVRPGVAIAEARPVSLGRTICFVEGSLSNELGQALARATATFKVKQVK